MKLATQMEVRRNGSPARIGMIQSLTIEIMVNEFAKIRLTQLRKRGLSRTKWQIGDVIHLYEGKVGYNHRILSDFVVATIATSPADRPDRQVVVIDAVERAGPRIPTNQELKAAQMELIALAEKLEIELG